MLQCKVHMRLSCYDAGFKVNVGVEIRDHLNCIQLIRCIIIRGVRVVEDTSVLINDRSECCPLPLYFIPPLNHRH